MADLPNASLHEWTEAGIEWVRFELPDMHGTSRSKTIPVRHAFGYAERGLNMYGGASVLDSRSDSASTDATPASSLSTTSGTTTKD